MNRRLTKLSKALSSLGLKEASSEINYLIKTSSFTKSACIIAAGNFGDDFCMLKNRDRNYTPEVKIVQEIIDHVEIAYLKDEVTGWVEGMNEFGIGIINSALMVGRDEKEKELAKDDANIVKDGDNMIKALKENNIKDVIDVLVAPHNKIYGHTFVSDGKQIFSIEMTSKHGPYVTELSPDKIHVRTNHGVNFPDAGYTAGPSRRSSVLRLEKATKTLQEVDSPNRVAPSLVEKSQRSVHNPNNMVRDTQKMSTNSQMLLNLDRKILTLYLMPGKVEFIGLENSLPKDYESKILVEVFEFDKDKAGEVTTKAVDKKVDDLETEIFYFAYGSNMDEEQMEKRTPSSNPLGPAILGGYNLVFYSESKEQEGVASIVPKEGAKVDGALFRIKKKDLEKLDKYENSPKTYKRIVVHPHHRDYGTVIAQAYIHNKHIKQSPDKDYLKQIMESYEDLDFNLEDIIKNQE